nr:MAG TPA: hypothetical protein [Caudoviricetes sp.]
MQKTLNRVCRKGHKGMQKRHFRKPTFKML